MKSFADEVNEVLIHYHDVARAHGMDRALREAVESNVFTRRECAGLQRRVEQLEAERDGLKARLAEVEAEVRAIEWLRAECDTLRARVASLEAEVDRHRERANAAQVAWEGHQTIDCAIKCAREIEELLDTNDPVQAARAIKTLQAERDALKSDLLELAEAVWLQWGLILSDGRRDAGCLSTLEHARDILRRYGRIDERGRFAWEEVKNGDRGTGNRVADSPGAPCEA